MHNLTQTLKLFIIFIIIAVAVVDAAAVRQSAADKANELCEKYELVFFQCLNYCVRQHKNVCRNLHNLMPKKSWRRESLESGHFRRQKVFLHIKYAEI